MSEINMAELLPFWVNGSLAPDEAAAVDAAVRADGRLADEAAFLRGLRDRMRAEDPGFSPGELGLARLKRSIAAQGTTPARPMRVSLATAVAACLVAAALGVVLPKAFAPAPVEYLQASGGDSATLAVMLQPEARLSDLSALLLAEGLVIVDGPSAVGLYSLAPFDPETADLAALADRLRAHPDLIGMVELPE